MTQIYIVFVIETRVPPVGTGYSPVLYWFLTALIIFWIESKAKTLNKYRFPIRRPKSCVFFPNFIELHYPPGALVFIVEYEFDF